MSDDIARAVGASSAETVTIAGKECRIRPLAVRELTEVERDCLERYKRSYLQTFASNANLLPEEMRFPLIMEKMEEAARWDVDDLPPKFAYDGSKLKIISTIKALVQKHYGEKKIDDVRLRNLLVTMLDEKTLSEEQYTEMTGHVPFKAKIPYVNWWITAAFEGMITLVWTCVREDGISREDVITDIGGNLSLLADTARIICNLSIPEAKNG